MFFDTGTSKEKGKKIGNDYVTHVAMYLGRDPKTGKLLVSHAGTKAGVATVPLNDLMRYKYLGARRPVSKK